MIKTKAIILKSADLGETDRLLTIYSYEFGKIQVAARGTKKLESKLRCHLEPFGYSELILIEGKNFRIVKDAVLINQFLLMRKGLGKIKIAYKIMNIVDELIVGEEKDEDVWNLIFETLKKLNVGDVGDAISHIVKKFQDDLLRLLGYDPRHIKDLGEIY